MISSRWSRRLPGSLLFLLLLSVTNLAHATSSLAFRGFVQAISTGGSTTLGSPSGIVVDSSGNIFIADTVSSSGRIVEVNAQGTASVWSITGLTTALGSLSGIALDGSGNLYVVDTGNARVVKISSAGAATVIDTGSVALAAPQGIALDQSGDIFIADTGHNRIVEVASGGAAAALSITVATSPTTLSSPEGLAVGVSGNLYIADATNNRIVKLASGSATASVVSITGGVTLTAPSGIATDRIGNLFLCDHPGANARIAEVDTSGTGSVLYTGAETLSSTAAGIALDVFGTVYIADTGNSRALSVNPLLVMDSGATAYSSSLNKSAVGFGHIPLGSSTPVTLTLPFSTGSSSGLGNVKVLTTGTANLDFTATADTTCSSSTTSSTGCSVMVSFLPTAPGLRTGAVVLYDEDLNPILALPLYGWGDAPVAALAPNAGSVISTGGVLLSFPFQLALDGAGNIYDANDGGNLVKIAAGGGSATVVPPGSLSFGSEVTGVAIDGAGNLYISDHTNSRIIVLRPSGVASVLSISGLGATGLNHPTALALDGAGNLYISDWTNGRVVRVSSLFVTGSTATGIGTVIGTGSYTTSAQGITGVAVDWMGNIYIPDGYNGTDTSRIIKVTAAGVVSLLAPTGITFSRPRGVSVDAMGNIYIADGGNNRIIKVTVAGEASVLTVGGLPVPTTLGSPFGITVDSFGNLYIPDSGNNRVLFVNVSGAALSFSTSTKVGFTDSTDGAKTATVTNLGNLPLIFSTNPTYTADFTNDSSDTNPCMSSTSLSAGALCDVAVKFTPQSVGSISAGIAVTNNTLNVAGSTQQVSVSGTGTNPGDTTSTAVTISPSSQVRGQGATITATITDTTSGHTATIPTGTISLTDTVGTTITTLNSGASVTLSAGKATLTGVVFSGLGTHTITATYAGVTGSFLTSGNTATATLSKAPVTMAGPTTQPVTLSPGQTGSVAVTVTPPYTTIGAPTGTLAYNILNASSTSVASGSSTLTAGSGSSTATVPIANTLATGSYTLSLTYGGDGDYAASTAATTIQVLVSKQAPTISLVSNTNPILVTGTVTFTATVGATAGTPTGSVGFYDGTTLLGTITLSSGVASFTTSSLSAGPHSITAVYGGDTNFVTVTSGAVTETVTDFTIGTSSGSGSGSGSGGSSSTPTTVAPGGTLSYTIAIVPTSGVTLPTATYLTVSGLPTGATATVPSSTWSQLTATSWSFPANTSLTNPALNFNIPSTTAKATEPSSPARRSAPLLWGLLLLPFAGLLRRTGKRLSRILPIVLMLAASLALLGGLSGCSAGNGFFNQKPTTYNVTVTVTSGALSHSTVISFNVQ